MLFEILSRPMGIQGDRVLQLAEIAVLLFIAQLLEETHSQMPPVQLARPVEQVHFQQRPGYRVDGRPQAEACHAGTHAFHFDDQNAAERRWTAQRNVGGGKTEVATELPAM